MKNVEERKQEYAATLRITEGWRGGKSTKAYFDNSSEKFMGAKTSLFYLFKRTGKCEQNYNAFKLTRLPFVPLAIQWKNKTIRICDRDELIK